jgi:HK97 family phage prohead protease
MASALKVKRNATPPPRRLLFAGGRKRVTPPRPPVPTAPREEFGICEHDGKRFYARKSGDELFLCLPDPSGILWKTSERILVPPSMSFHSLGETNFPVTREGKFSSFQTRPEVTVDEKMMTVRDADQRVVDYRDVAVEGMASTFTEDRDKETILEGAFNRTLADFKRNPVLLMDHQNSVHNIAGSFSRIRASSAGLEVRGEISNAPELRKIRFLVAEKHLRAFSIGGLFRYSEENFSQIKEVSLFEVSLVAVPANQEALFQSRGLRVDDAKKAFDLFSRVS